MARLRWLLLAALLAVGGWICVEAVGRLFEPTEVINVGGSKVFPAEVESVLLDLANVVISANKGPVAHAYADLAAEARATGRQFLFEGAVMDGIPVFSLVRGFGRASLDGDRSRHGAGRQGPAAGRPRTVLARPRRVHAQGQQHRADDRHDHEHDLDEVEHEAEQEHRQHHHQRGRHDLLRSA